MGGVGNGVAEEDLHWDLNPGVAAMQVLTHGFGSKHAVLGGPHGLGALFTTLLRKQERFCRTRDRDM